MDRWGVLAARQLGGVECGGRDRRAETLKLFKSQRGGDAGLALLLPAGARSEQRSRVPGSLQIARQQSGLGPGADSQSFKARPCSSFSSSVGRGTAGTATWTDRGHSLLFAAQLTPSTLRLEALACSGYPRWEGPCVLLSFWTHVGSWHGLNLRPQATTPDRNCPVGPFTSPWSDAALKRSRDHL